MVVRLRVPTEKHTMSIRDRFNATKKDMTSLVTGEEKYFDEASMTVRLSPARLP